MLFSVLGGWLYEHHPRTAIQYLHLTVQPLCKVGQTDDRASHGYWKDLLNLVCLVLLGQLNPDRRRARFLNQPRTRRQYYQKSKITAEEAKENDSHNHAEAKSRRAKRHQELHNILIEKLAEDPTFRALYIVVSRLFADQLDRIEALPRGRDYNAQRKALGRQISLAGRGAPTPDRTHDRHCTMATAISMLIYFAQAFALPRGLGITPDSTVSIAANEAHILRSFYRRWILCRLRVHTHCPEPLMSGNRWQEFSTRACHPSA